MASPTAPRVSGCTYRVREPRPCLRVNRPLIGLLSLGRAATTRAQRHGLSPHTPDAQPATVGLHLATGNGRLAATGRSTFLVRDKKTKTSGRGGASAKKSAVKDAPRTPRAGKPARSAKGPARPTTAPARHSPRPAPAAPASAEPRNVALVPEVDTGDERLFEGLEDARDDARLRGGSAGSSSLPAFVLEDDEGLALDEDGISLGDEPTPAGTGASEPSPRGEPTLLPGGGTLVRLDPLARYLAEVRRYPPLDRDEEIRLARSFRSTRDPETAQRLITSNLSLVVKIARLFRRAVVNVLDLIQEGNVGLLHALDRFDPEVGVKFSTYASWWIKAYILKYLLDNTRLVRVGTTNARRKLLYNLNREKRRLEAAGFTAGPKLLAERFGVSERDVVDVEQSLRGGDLALDAPVGEDGATTRGDLLASEEPSVEDEVARQELKDLLDAKLAVFRAGLSEKEAAILDARLLADTPATLQEIGDRYKITREAVRQAEKRLTDRLRAYLTAELGEEAVLQFRKR